MSRVTPLTAAIALGAAAASLAPVTHAGDWSIGVGVTVPGVVVTTPPGYYGPAVVCYDGYVDAYGRYHCRHRHYYNDDDDDD